MDDPNNIGGGQDTSAAPEPQQAGAPPPPPPGFSPVPAVAPASASTTSPAAPPPPPAGFTPIPPPAMGFTSPQTRQAAHQAQQEQQSQQQHGVVSRYVEGTIDPIAKPLESALVEKPIDTYTKMTKMLQTGDHAGALQYAWEIYNKLSSDSPDNPLVKGAYNVIVSVGKSVAKTASDTYKADRAAGHGVVASGVDALPGVHVRERMHSLSSTLRQGAQDMNEGNTAGVVGDAITQATQQPGANTVSDALGQGVTSIDDDLHKHNYRAVAGDALSAATNLATMVAPEVGLGEGAATAEDIAKAGGTPPTATQGRITRAVQNMKETRAAAEAAPGNLEKAQAFHQAVAEAHEAVQQRVSETFQAASDQVNTNHQAASADQQQALMNHQYIKQGAEDTAASMANSAEPDSLITQNARDSADNAEQDMKDRYAERAGQIQDLTKNQSVPFENSPIHQTAQELLGQGEGKGPLTKATAKSLPGSPQANQILNNLTGLVDDSETAQPLKGLNGEPLTPEEHADLLSAHGMEPVQEAETILDKPKTDLTVPDLMESYRKLNENMRNLGWDGAGRQDRVIYSKLKKSIMDTVGQIADQSGNPDAIKIAGEMNSDYAENARLYENPAVKALQEGKLQDVDARLAGRQASMGDIATFKKVLGDQGFQDFANGSLKRMVADAVNTDGTPNYAKVLKKLGSMNPEVRESMYGGSASTLMDTLNQLKNSDDGIDAATKNIDTLDKTTQEQLKGIGQTADQKHAEINKSIQDIVGNGDISGLANDPQRLQRLTDTIGPQGVAQLGKMEIQSKLREFSTSTKAGSNVIGPLDTDKFLNWYTETFQKNPEAAQALFKPDKETEAAFTRFMGDVENQRYVKEIFKNVAIRGTSLVGGGLIGSAFGPIQTLIGLAVEGGLEKAGARVLVDKIANSPAAWKAMGWAGKAADNATVPVKAAAGVVKSAGKVVAAGADATQKAVRTTPGKAALAGAYAGANDPLGGKP
jgi:hypothetical protein